MTKFVTPELCSDFEDVLLALCWRQQTGHVGKSWLDWPFQDKCCSDKKREGNDYGTAAGWADHSKKWKCCSTAWKFTKVYDE